MKTKNNAEHHTLGEQHNGLIHELPEIDRRGDSGGRPRTFMPGLMTPAPEVKASVIAALLTSPVPAIYRDWISSKTTGSNESAHELEGHRMASTGLRYFSEP